MPHEMGVPLLCPIPWDPRLCIINCQHMMEPMEQGCEKQYSGGSKSLISHPQSLRDSQGLGQPRKKGSHGRTAASDWKGLRQR